MPVVTRRELLEAGVHFGHQTRRWNPKMQRFLYGERSGIYIIDLEKSLAGIEETHEFVQALGRRRGIVLFIGTKKQAQEVVQDHATRIGMPYVNHRWLGGMLTNFTTISKRLLRLRELHEMERTGALDYLPKKEAIRLRHERDKLTRNLGGIQDLERLPDAVFVIDTKKEHIAVNEARKLGIPVIAIVDTNCDPDEVDFAIPGNDDAIRAVSLVTRVVADALAEGYGMAKDEDVERVTARSASPAPSGPRATAAPARVEEHETPSAEDAAKIAASTVFEPDVPEPAPPADDPAPAGAPVQPEQPAASARPSSRRLRRRPGSPHERHADRRRGEAAPRRDGRGHDGLQEGAHRVRWRLRPGRRVPAREGPRLGGQARRAFGQPGPRRRLRALQQHGRGPGRGELRDRLRRQDRRLPSAREGHRAAHREPVGATLPHTRRGAAGRARARCGTSPRCRPRKPGSPSRCSRKIVDGKLNAYIADIVLLEQPFVKDDGKTVQQLLDEASAKLGERLAVRRFVRFKLGEAGDDEATADGDES